MNNDTRSPEQIERDIERDRQALSQNLNGIQQKFSFDTIAGQIGEQFREHGGDISRAMANSVKENPMAVALTGVGLAWMIFGSGRNGNGSRQHAGYGAPLDSDRSTFQPQRDSTVGYGTTRQYPAQPDWARDDGGYGDDDGRPLIDQISENASDAAASVRSGAQSASDRAAEVRDRLAQGTENLSDAARERVVAARATALDAKRKMARTARRGAAKASDLFEQQPLVSGALSFAVGAAIAGALPRTQAENEALGEHSDALIAEAERLFKEEQGNATRVLGAAAEEAKSIAEEKRRDGDGAAAPGDRKLA